MFAIGYGFGPSISVAAPPEDPEATLWVNASTGDDSRSKATVAASGGTLPWLTIGRAAWGSTNRAAPNTSEAASAGDVVLIAAGTYDAVGTEEANDPYWRPVNSGTSTDPIIFRGYLDEPVVEGTSANSVILTQSTGTGPLIGTGMSAGTDYIIWEGFYIDEANATPRPDRAVINVLGTTGSQIRNCEVKGTYIEWPGNQDDNHNAIRFEQVAGCRAANNRLYDIGSMEEGTPDTPGRGQNDAAIMFYDVGTTIIENNLIYQCGCGVFIKGDHAVAAYPAQDNIIRYNRILNNEHCGIRAIDSLRDLVYQNIITGIYDPEGGATSGIWIGFFAPDGTVFANNVVDDCLYAVHMQDADVHQNIEVKNNIFTNCNWGVVSSVSVVADPTTEHDFNRNGYYNMSQGVGSTPGGGEDITLAQWQASFAWIDVDSSDANPQFVGGGNYHLSNSGQAALTLGRVVHSIGGTNGSTIPAGAYITGSEVIGLDI